MLLYRSHSYVSARHLIDMNINYIQGVITAKGDKDIWTLVLKEWMSVKQKYKASCKFNNMCSPIWVAWM